MAYFQPKVIYRNPDEDRVHSIVRYIGNRVLRNNKNFLCAVVGATGSGKSWGCIAIAEIYSIMFGIEFNPECHIISSLKELLILINENANTKKIGVGSIIIFDEPQVDSNSRSWQSEMNQAFSRLISTFRNQRLVLLFALPFIEMLDKQSRILFHGEFKVLGFDKNTKVTTIKPRFLEYNKKKDDFYRKRLIVQYKVNDKNVMNTRKLHLWHIDKPSDTLIDIYERKKKRFTDDLNKKLLDNLLISEKNAESKNKSEELFKVQGYYDEFGEDYVKILQKMPNISPFTLEKYIQFIKKSKKIHK